MRDVLKIARVNLGIEIPKCEDCKWRRGDPTGGTLLTCCHLTATIGWGNRPDGKPWLYCVNNRMDDESGGWPNPCGTKGKYWEPEDA